MGNSFGCSASGERLISAARDGDFVEAKMLLDCNPCLAKYSTFGGLNSPLHFAAAKGHNEIVALLLENGADVNSRNYCGQTALMQACRYGHWEVVQTLLLFRCNVTRADYLSGRTALHFAAVNGHVRCMRLVLADFVPSSAFECMDTQPNGDRNGGLAVKSKHDQSALSKFVNKAADGGITALHMAALNGYFDCVQLLLDLHANVSAVTFHYGTSMDLIGAGSTPLHYAACGGNLKCCQILLAKGANRMTLNCNGWLPLDVARMWGRHWLEPVLAPNSDSIIPVFPPSHYLSLPLMSVLNIAREYGLQMSATLSDDADTCAVCLERACSVAAEANGETILYIETTHPLITLNDESFILKVGILNMRRHLLVARNSCNAEAGVSTLSPELDLLSESAACCPSLYDTMLKLETSIKSCGHELCVRCALYLCSTSNIPSELLGPPGSIPCPLCRHGIVSFNRLPGMTAKESKLHLSLGLCTSCMLHPQEQEESTPSGSQDIRKNRVVAVSSDIFCPVTCSPFPSVAIPLCTCNDGPCPNFEIGDNQVEGESPHSSQSTSVDADKMEAVRLGKTTCSSMFWGRRSGSREHQCNAEINT